MEIFRPVSIPKREPQTDVHPTVAEFLSLSSAEVVRVYSERHPDVDQLKLLKILNNGGEHFRWAGVDLIPTLNGAGEEQMTVIETNSAAGRNGLKTRTVSHFHDLVQRSFLPWLQSLEDKREGSVVNGGIAVFFDLEKNTEECRIYAQIIADYTNEAVYLVNIGSGEVPYVRWSPSGAVSVWDGEEWRGIRAAFRRVVQKPWTKIPVSSATVFFNPVGACLAGGRNKIMAAEAYAHFNALNANLGTGLKIGIPISAVKVPLEELKNYGEIFGYLMVVKIPYSNAGTGVYVITSESIFEEFLESVKGLKGGYDQFLVQALICPQSWARGAGEKEKDEAHLSHRLTSCSGKKGSFAFDLRLEVISTPAGWAPSAIFARRCAKSLEEGGGGRRRPEGMEEAAKIFKTNLTKPEDGKCEASRLVSVAREEFATLNLTLADVVEAFVQASLAATAVDDRCKLLMNWQGTETRPGLDFNVELFEELSGDAPLVNEILSGLTKLNA